MRDYINDEKGISLSFSSNQTIERSFSIDYSLDPSQEYYLVSFLQDDLTKEVCQAENLLISEEDSIPIEEDTIFSLSAVCLLDGIELNWESVSNAKGGYNIYKKLATDKEFPSMPLTDFPITETQYTVIKGLQKCFW